MREKIHDTVCGVVIAVLSFFFSIQSHFNLFMNARYAGVDSSVFRTVAMYMRDGYMPYRDIFDHKGPLLYLYNRLGMLISDWKGMWVIEWLSLWITFWLIYKIARLICGRLLSLVTLLTVGAALFPYFDGGNYSEEYALPYIAASLFLFADYFLKGRVGRLRLVVCGFCFGAVCLLRANMIAVWLVFCVAVLLKEIREKRYDKLVGFALWFAVGAAVVTVPIVIWLAANGAFGDFIENYLLFNGAYVSDADRASKINQYRAFSYFANNTFVLFSGCGMCYFCAKKRDIFHVSYLLSFFTSLLMICISGQQYPHYGMVLIPLMSYPTAILLGEKGRQAAENRVFVLVAAYLLAVAVLPQWISGLDHAAECYWHRGNYVRGDEIGVIADWIRENTGEDDRITVYGNDNIFYVLSDRLSASKYSYQLPIGEVDPDILDEYYAQLRKNHPKVIVVRTDELTEEMEDFIAQFAYEKVHGSGEWQVFYLP